jgi:hypothetical protein
MYIHVSSVCASDVVLNTCTTDLVYPPLPPRTTTTTLGLIDTEQCYASTMCPETLPGGVYDHTTFLHSNHRTHDRRARDLVALPKQLIELAISALVI